MKGLFVALILATGVGGYLVALQLGKRDAAAQVAAAQAQWDKERAELETSLKSSRSRRSTPTLVAPSMASATNIVIQTDSPEAIIARLQGIRVPAGRQGTRAIRKVVHELEKLVEIGEPAVPAIADFLRRFEDVDYQARENVDETAADIPAVTEASEARDVAATEAVERTRRRGDDGERRGREAGGAGAFLRDALRGPRQVRLEFMYPPTLRIGLIDVLREIGGSEAEGALGEMLSSTGRPVEVAYLAKTLQGMRPDAYREAAVGAAKELLLEPPQVSSSNRLDRDGKAYLFHVLTMFGDNSFVDLAQNTLVTPEGRLDRNTFDYLRSLDANGVPGLVQAYNDSRVTNIADKASIANTVLGYVGPNPQANALLQQILTDQSVPARMRAMSLFRLMRENDDPNLAAQRIPIIEQARAMTQEPDIQRAADAALQGLNSIKAGERPDIGSIFRGAMGGGDRPRPDR